ncbi:MULTISPECIES: OprD family outer membrane porin [Acinetobacter calcoaceticus/baumannii complex]|uniref:OprD family outer membrane porin n=1 Tax=Acinetobacter calcoaceticus/baumannii complex TaxID=909768 RepID=UPI0024471DD1|nr:MULTISPECIES: OprD family outer membrane porin [Acinetobacter calcoaceticus/baumannii complex]MDH2595958.1 OprD family outer membrane porin [Acinetobacter baumannii]MDO7537222.1 OprD family outer membrane porin [Acinetobacter pittii]
MMQSMSKLLMVGAVLAAPSVKANIFFEDDKLSVMNRNFLFYRDFRDGGYNPSGANVNVPVSEKEGYRNEWAQGLVVNYFSGYSSGELKFGFDLYGLLGIKLYSDPYKTGTNLLQIDSEGNAKDAYGEIGGALKLKYKNTVLTYGNQFPNNPIIATSTIRLLPSVSTGVTIQNTDLENLLFDAGYFYKMNPVDSTRHLNYFTTDYGMGIKADSISYIGAKFKKDSTSIQAYASELEDVWNQYYLGIDYTKPLENGQKAKISFSNYSTKSTGAEKGGEIESHMAAASLSYTLNNHSFLFGYQQVFGNEPFDYVGFSTVGSNAYVANAAQYATFSEAHEKSLQLKYDLDLSPYGIPGLSFMARYVYGWDIDNTHSNNNFYTKRFVYNQDIDHRHWERDFQIGYKVQDGFAKNLDIKLRQATHRSTAGYRYIPLDEIRLIIEFPLSL